MWYKVKRILTWVNEWGNLVEKQIYPAVKPIYKWEYIEYKMNADSSWKLYAPISWIWHDWWNYSNPYSWKISVDWGTATTYSWTWSAGWTIQLSWYTSWSNHTVKIVPTTESYWWALAFWFNQTSIKGYLTEIVYDASYMWYAISATDTWDYVRYLQYRWCTLLTKPAEEYMPDTVTTIWKSFRGSQYSWCTGLIYSTEEALSDNVTTIWNSFRANQYNGCTSLTEIKWWKDLSIWNNYYRHYQYSGCTSNKTVKVLSDVGYNSSNQNTLQNDYVTSVSVPSAYLTNFKNSSNYPRTWITDSKFIWY